MTLYEQLSAWVLELRRRQIEDRKAYNRWLRLLISREQAARPERERRK